MTQINDTSTIQDEGKGQRALRGFLRYFWTISLIGFGVILVPENANGGIALISCGVLYFLFLNKLAWGIGNTVRKWVMPTAYLSTDATDAFRQKIFWNVGPQFMATFFTWGALLWLVEFAVGIGIR